MSVPEIVRGEFVFHDAFFASVGVLKRHPRASVAELTTLLRPETAQKSNAAKDQVGHWYEAQLLHYGLPRSKDKNTAKMRLLQALNQGSLTVPANIRGIETEMRKEYTAAQRKAKALEKVQNASSAEKTPAKGKKRKQDEAEHAASTKTSIKVKVGDVTFDIEQLKSKANKTSTTDRSNVKKQKADSVKPDPKAKPTPKDKPTGKDKPAPKDKPDPKDKPAPKAKPAPKEKPAPKDKLAASKKASSAKADLKSESKSSSKISSTTTKASNPKTATKKKQTAPSSVLDAARFARENNLPYDPPPAHTEFDDSQCYDVNSEMYDRDSDVYDDDSGAYHDDFQSRNEPRTITISGSYTLHVPRIEEQAPGSRLRFDLIVDNPNGKIWGRFDFSLKTGIILISDIPSAANRNATSFGWRATDEYDGSLKFGSGCDGTIEFDGDGLVRGVFYGLMNGEDIEFEGEREGTWSTSAIAQDFEVDWDDYPRLAYGR
ncbi:hypothetical protein AAFC00_004840 [Neodothiora populina]|uniref:Uncharacterized protein n=1 Tax=Neodothiora populina TaxID=2781224 RepID=A0ABR3P3T3_9PEZI